MKKLRNFWRSLVSVSSGIQFHELPEIDDYIKDSGQTVI